MTTAYLDAVRAARELRDTLEHDTQAAEHDFRLALVRAYRHHSLREIAPAAGLTHAGVRYLITQTEGDKP